MAIPLGARRFSRPGRIWQETTVKYSAAWREGFICTFPGARIPQLGIKIAAPAMRRFWTMLSHYHGQIWNASKVAGALGLSDKKFAPIWIC